MKKTLFVITLLASIILSSCSEEINLQNGDLIFQDLDCKMCDAIELVTMGHKGHSISHMGIIKIEDDKIYVIEAFDSVQEVTLEEFLSRSYDRHNKPKIMIGRLKPQYQKYIPNAIKNAESLLGKPYDDVFDINNDKYYCSELVFKSFVDENSQPLFELSPMTFKLKDGTPVNEWLEYFEKLGVQIPEGKPGCNPAEYSKSKLIKIIYDYTNNSQSLNTNVSEMLYPPMM